jgi:hypothetical protein
VSGVSPFSGHSVTVVQIQTPDITPDAVTNSVRHIGTGGQSTTSGTEADISGETVTLDITDAGSVLRGQDPHERGQHNPSLVTLQKLAKALGVPVTELLG